MSDAHMHTHMSKETLLVEVADVMRQVCYSGVLGAVCRGWGYFC